MTFEPLPPPVEPHLDRVAPLHPGQRVGDFRHARAEVRRGIRRRSELLVAADEERRQRIRKLRRRGNARECSARRRPTWPAARRSAPTVRLRLPDAQLVQDAAGKRVLVVRGERPRRRVLRTQRAGGHAAALGERRHRDEAVAEIREAAEQLIAVRRKPVIDADVPLILVVDLAGGARGSCSRCPPRSAAGYRCSSASATGSMRLGGNRVARKRRAHRARPSSRDRR